MYSTKAKVLKIIVLVIVFINGYSSIIIKEHCSSKVNPFSLGGAFPLASYV